MNAEIVNETLPVDGAQTVFIVEYIENEQIVIDSVYRFVTHADERRNTLSTQESFSEVNIRPCILM